MAYLIALVVEGLLSGAVYGLIALALVVTHRASRAINFALGEWMTLGAILVAGIASALPFGASPIGVGIAFALGLVAMQLLAAALARGALVPLTGRHAIATIMLTLGLGILLRGIIDLALAGVPRRLALPLAETVVTLGPLAFPGLKLLAAALGIAGVAAVSWFYRYSRAGIALRALADDRPAAEALGIDSGRYLAVAWGIAGALAMSSGVLWMALTSGGFSLALLGLKILPILMLGGLDSVGGTLVAAMLIGILESVASGYLDPVVGTGIGGLLPNVVLIAIMLVRPAGLFGQAKVARV